jgi:hypothetical protein
MTSATEFAVQMNEKLSIHLATDKELIALTIT